MDYELCFVGAGNMAEAIARAAIDRKVLTPAQIAAADPVHDRRQVFADMGVTVGPDAVSLARGSRQILLAVKPQQLASLGELLGTVDPQMQVVVSIMAGIPSRRIESMIGGPARVVRVMPNTPLMAGQGMAGLSLGSHAQQGDAELAMRLMSAAGKAVLVDEADLDAITAVSGSGPAYLFYLAEAMHRAAVELGLRDHADLLVRQTLLGAATLLAESDLSPAELRKRVTSPGGTTEAAIAHMDGNVTQQVIINAVKAAQRRSLELAGR